MTAKLPRTVPEPWEWTPAQTGEAELLVGGRPTLCEVFVCDVTDGTNRLRAKVMSNLSPDTAEKYARLMAAAPELLDALKAALPILNAYIPPDQFDGHAARALIMVRDAIGTAEA